MLIKKSLSAVVILKSTKQLPKLKHPGYVLLLAITYYRNKISHLTQFPVKGVIWYQGEADAMFSKGEKYRRYLEALIKDWRQKWNASELPFVIVQLANYKSNGIWAELRDSQLAVAQKVPHTDMVVTIDIGDPVNIHPDNKAELGKRIALCVRHSIYNESVPFSGPVYKSMEVSDAGKVILSFDHADGLMVKNNGDNGGTLHNFIIAGSNKRFVPAQANVSGRKVIVWSDKVPNPQAIRYAWSDSPAGGLLYNKYGLPASPFRTDNWKLRTEKR